MALADIISKIESDAADEVAAILEAANARVAEIHGAAQARAVAHREEALAAAALEGEREASRIVVAAKLAARDESLAARRAVISEALEATAAGLAELPVDRYADFLARQIAAAARGGEVVRFGSLDAKLTESVVNTVARLAPDLALTVAPEPAPFERGALLEGDRVRANLSLKAIVEEQRDALELVLAAAIFGEGE